MLPNVGVQQHEDAEQRFERERLLTDILHGRTYFEKLESLDLSCRLLGFEALDRLLGLLEIRPQLALHHLNLSFNDLAPAGAQRLAESSIIDQLESLKLSGNELSDKGVAALCRSGEFSALSALTLSYNSIGDEGSAILASAQCFPHVKELDLRRNRIGDQGVQALCASTLPGRLRILNLDYNELGSKGYDMLTEAFASTQTFMG